MTITTEQGFNAPLFDGRTLEGWYAIPRSYGTMWPGGPTVGSLRIQQRQPNRSPANLRCSPGAVTPMTS